MKKYTLSHAIGLWSRSKETKNSDPNSLKYLKVALKQYVLPNLYPEVIDLKTKEFASFCETIDVYKLNKAIDIFDARTAVAMNKQILSDGSRRNYRSALKRFTNWLNDQCWWQNQFPSAVPDHAPRFLKVPKRRMQAMAQGRLQNYTLREEQISNDLALELRQLEVFRRCGGQKELTVDAEGNEQEKMLLLGVRQRPGCLPKIEKAGERTWENEKSNILLFLGWYINIKGHASEEATLLLTLDLNLLAEYNFWSVNTRKNTHSTGYHSASAAITVAKWLNFRSSQRRDWSDIDEIVNIRNLRADFKDKYKQEKKVTDDQKWQHKEMSHAEARQMIEQLRAYCAPLSAKYEFDPKAHIHEPWYTRSGAVVWRCWQTYLILKFLVYCPVRQGEIRTLKLNETLFRRTSESGKPYYVVLTESHKNYNLTRKKRHYRLPDILTKDLDFWINECMPEAKKAVESLENWMKFWGHRPDLLKQKKEALRKAKEEGVKGIKARPSTSFEGYIKNLEMDVKGLELRIEGWKAAKVNIESLEYLFCKTGKRYPHTFGVPLGRNNVWAIVTEAVSRATLDLFGEERSLRTNPHAFRHIAEKQVRAAGNDAAAFGTFIGHSEAMGKLYADQITSEYEVTEEIANGWWIDE